MSVNLKTYSPIEEKLNIYSHALGAILGAIGLILLLIKGIVNKNALEIASYFIYSLSMIVLFTASTLYHSAKDPEKRLKLKVFDHAAIYFLIAGSYTPFTLIGLRGIWGWSIFGVAWAVGIFGIIMKLFFTGRFNLLSTISYVVMGWIVIIAIKPLINNLTPEALFWLAAGGAFYTLGAVLYSIKKIPFNHAIFHLFVIAGAASHFIAVMWYL